MKPVAKIRHCQRQRVFNGPLLVPPIPVSAPRSAHETKNLVAFHFQAEVIVNHLVAKAIDEVFHPDHGVHQNPIFVNSVVK